MLSCRVSVGPLLPKQGRAGKALSPPATPPTCPPTHPLGALLQAGQALDLAAVPHLSGHTRGLGQAPAAPSPRAAGGYGGAAGRIPNHMPQLAPTGGGAAPPLPALVPVRLQLAAGGGAGGPADEAVVVGRRWLGANSDSTEGLVRLLAEQCGALQGIQVRYNVCVRGGGLGGACRHCQLPERADPGHARPPDSPQGPTLLHPHFKSRPPWPWSPPPPPPPPPPQFDLLCATAEGGPLLRVPPAAVEVSELLAAAHCLALRQRR